MAQLAAELDISLSTLKKWCRLHEALKTSIKNARDADEHIEDALYKRAHGYEVTETKMIMKADGKGGQVIDKVERVTKHVPPSEVAMIFWLKNRRATKWRNEPVPDVSGNDLVVDQAMVNAKPAPGAVPPLVQPGKVQDGAGGPPQRQDGAGEAEAGSQPVGLPD